MSLQCKKFIIIFGGIKVKLNRDAQNIDANILNKHWRGDNEWLFKMRLKRNVTVLFVKILNSVLGFN
jgi:hypothetical protein